MPETNFFWDPLSDNILQERDETGAVTAEYTTEPGLYGNLISQSRGGGAECQYHFDALGSTLALTDDNQQVTDNYAYRAFGDAIEHIGNTVNSFQYIGQQSYRVDDVSSCLSVRMRDYRPGDGRWLSVDPLSTQFARHCMHWGEDLCQPRQESTKGSASAFIPVPELFIAVYAYVINRPTWRTDPNGLEFPCKDDERPIPKKGFKPVINGCTDVQDCPAGGANFKPACDLHDACYQTCKKTKAECDDAFLKDLRTACARVRHLIPLSSEEARCLGPGYPSELLIPEGQCIDYTYETCMVGAQGYYDGVTRYFRERAQKAYEDSQKAACDCVKK